MSAWRSRRGRRRIRHRGRRFLCTSHAGGRVPPSVPWHAVAHNHVARVQVVVAQALAAQELNRLDNLAPNHGNAADGKGRAAAAVLFLPGMQRVGLGRGGVEAGEEGQQGRGPAAARGTVAYVEDHVLQASFDGQRRHDNNVALAKGQSG